MPVAEELSIRFWGVRGSYPTPGPSTLRYGGNTSCLSVQVMGCTLVFDAGTGIIQLGRELVRKARQDGVAPRAAVLFSHYHHDHTQGFPFFAPTRQPDACLRLFGPQLAGASTQDVLGRILAFPLFPVLLDELPAGITYTTLQDGSTLYAGEQDHALSLLAAGETLPLQPDQLVVKVQQSPEHLNGVLHYRVEWRGRSIVYATDREGPIGPDHPLVSFARGADLLIHDAQYTDEHYLGNEPGKPSTQGFGHSTIEGACEAARLAGVKQLALFHLDPLYDDDRMSQVEAYARTLFPGAFASKEGLDVRLPALT